MTRFFFGPFCFVVAFVSFSSNASSSKSADARSSAANAASVSFSSFAKKRPRVPLTVCSHASPRPLETSAGEEIAPGCARASDGAPRAEASRRDENEEKASSAAREKYRRSGSPVSFSVSHEKASSVSDASRPVAVTDPLRVVCALLALRQSSSLSSEASSASPSSRAFCASARAVRGDTRAPLDRPRANDARRFVSAGGTRSSAASATASAKGEALEGAGRRAHRRHSARSPRRDTHAPMRARAVGMARRAQPSWLRE
jgi:hypothetical protein